MILFLSLIYPSRNLEISITIWKRIGAKNGSGLRLEAEAMWFQILQPVMTDAHSTLDDLASGPKDTSFVQYQDDSLSGTDDESDENESSEDGEHYLLYTKYIAKPYF